MQDELWDAIIVGAGPAGALSAGLLSDRGWRVLLVERSRWPRDKVCGGCVNTAAIELLDRAGVGSVLAGAHPLRHFALNIQRRQVGLPLPQGAAVPRDFLDAGLVAAALERGAVFIAETTATLLPAAHDAFREVRLDSPTETRTVRTRLLLTADGISGTTLRHEPWAAWTIAANSHFGVAATLDTLCTPRHTIAMHVGPAGYVGLAPYADGRTHLAAALDPAQTRSLGGPRDAVRAILNACGHPIPDALGSAKFYGTPHLTRRRKIFGHHRTLALGDACGYVEPFTGEGIAWALRSATEVVAVLPDSVRSWPSQLPAQWLARHRAAIGHRQRLCRLLRHTLRHPHLAQAAVAVANFFPRQGAALVQAIGHQSFAAPALAGAPR